MIKGILFDKDGTLIDFSTMWHPIIGRTLHRMQTEFKLRDETINKISRVSGFSFHGFEKESVIQYYATSKLASLWNRILQEEKEALISESRILQIMEEEALNDSNKVILLEGVAELLEELKNKDYSIGLATADTKRSTYFCLEKAGILKYFQYIGCDEDSEYKKPEAALGKMFCRQESLFPAEVLVVGDSLTDMEFANRLGSHFVGIRSDHNGYESFQKNHAVSTDKIMNIVQLFHL